MEKQLRMEEVERKEKRQSEGGQSSTTGPSPSSRRARSPRGARHQEAKSCLTELVEEKRGKEESVQFKNYTVTVKNTRVEMNRYWLSLLFSRAASPTSPATKKKQL